MITATGINSKERKAPLHPVEGVVQATCCYPFASLRGAHGAPFSPIRERLPEPRHDRCAGTLPDVDRLARTIGDASRIRMLTLLNQCPSLTAKELAYSSGITPATASVHLQRLESDGLVRSRVQGRNKHFSLTSEEVAQLVEWIAVLAPPRHPSGAAPSRADQPLRVARLCYDHFAGRLGARVTAALVAHGVLERQPRVFVVTNAGDRWLSAFGIDMATVQRARRKLAYRCLDWSEREDHLGGALGAAVAARMIALHWVEQNKNAPILSVTETGRVALAEYFGFTLQLEA
jgi:DNA-binding transcriptional ArsR family regulator